ncbi:MAG: hypothetical protein IJ427_10100 [Lachnospiraceae bacterium]|nr:hypothetical protein [Lachnospiraceae bacterium]
MARQKGKKIVRALGISLATVVLVLSGLFFFWYASFANMKNAETAYFDKDGKFVCSEENPFREELLSKLVSVCMKPGAFEEASPYAWDKTLLENRDKNFSEFTILTKDGAKYEIYDYAPLSPNYDIEGVTLMKRPQRYLYIERTKGEKNLIYRVKFDEKAEEIWELIGKAKGYAYNQMGTFRTTVISCSEASRSGILDSPEYGRMSVRAQSFGWAKPGDTVEVTMLKQTSRFGINDRPWVKIEKVE